MFLTTDISPEIREKAIVILSQISDAEKYSKKKQKSSEYFKEQFSKALTSKLIKTIDTTLK